MSGSAPRPPGATQPPGAPRKYSGLTTARDARYTPVPSYRSGPSRSVSDASHALFDVVETSGEAAAPNEAPNGNSAPSRPSNWLSGRQLVEHNEHEASSSAFIDTPTARHTSMGAPRGLVQYQTPSQDPSSTSALFSQITRGMAASRRQLQRQNHQPNASSRVSLASSSGWGSPRPLLANSARDQDAIAGPSRLPSRIDAQMLPRTPSAEHAGVPRISIGQSGASAINQDGSYSVMRSEEEANNSGLLALTPAMRRVHGLGLTSMHPRVSKTSSEASSVQINGSKVSTEPSERNSTNQSIIEYDLDGAEVASSEELEARRAQLLQSGTHSHEEQSELVEVMRNWREDAMKHHLYDTAIFWGNKILSLETEQVAWNDAYNLATAYFLTHRYAQAEHLLCSPLVLQQTHLQDVEDGWEEENSDENLYDEVGAAVAATRRSSRLPPSMLNKAQSMDDAHGSEQASMLSGADRKRKRQGFSLSEAGTGSEADSEKMDRDGGSVDEVEEVVCGHEGVQGKDAPDGINEEDIHTKLASAWRQEQRLAMSEVRRAIRPPPDSISLAKVSIPCKYLAAQCMVRQGKYQEALEELKGWHGENVEETAKAFKRPSKDGLIKLSSSIWHLKGLIQLHLRHVDAARESFMRSLSLDVKNFESFDQLVRGHLLTAAEQWDFVNHLEYVAQAGDDPAQREALTMVRLMYTALLDKTGKLHAQQTAAARRQLMSEYGLDQNADVLLGLAEEMYARMRYEDAYAVTSRIMELSKDHEASLPIHIASMFMIERLRPSLYLLAHHLTEVDPDLPAAWYAVGCWYFGTKRWLEARKHFSKCVQIDPRFAPGWVAFAHTFAHEGESDQAIVSYSTAERNFSAHYLIKLFLGMEHLTQGNLTLAQLYLRGSADVWEEDALSRNERGVVAYYNKQYDDAIALFLSALQAAEDVQQPAKAWAATYVNLGHAYRRTGQLQRAQQSFQRVVELDPDCTAAFTGAGLCLHGMGQTDEAISWYLRALALEPNDKHANDLVNLALQESAQRQPLLGTKEPWTSANNFAFSDSLQAAEMLHEQPDRSLSGTSIENGGDLSLASGSPSLAMDQSI